MPRRGMGIQPPGSPFSKKYKFQLNVSTPLPTVLIMQHLASTKQKMLETNLMNLHAHFRFGLAQAICPHNPATPPVTREGGSSPPSAAREALLSLVISDHFYNNVMVIAPE